MGSDNKTYWAVYDHERALKIWRDGELVGQIPQDEFPHLILQMAKALKNDDGKDGKV